MKRLVALLVAFTPAIAFAGKAYNTGKGDTWDCKKDPDVAININKGTFTFKGACKTIAVNGNSNTITVENASELDVNGNKNTITVASVERITANGNDNKLTYKKGTKPSISNNGTDNTVAEGDVPGGSTDKGDKPADKPADKGGDGGGAKVEKPGVTYGGGTIDCKKTPSFTVGTKGLQNVKFTGPCDKITVTTGQNTLTIESVKTLQLDGGGNTASIGSLDAVVLNGAGNTVTYKSGTAKQSGGGAMNTVTKK